MNEPTPEIIELIGQIIDWVRGDYKGTQRGMNARLHAMAWVWCRDKVGNRSLREMGKWLKCTDRAFLYHVHSFEQEFKARGARLKNHNRRPKQNHNANKTTQLAPNGARR